MPQWRINRKFIFALAILCMAAMTVHAGNIEDWMRHPVNTIPKLAKAPTIDGTINRAEWQLAAELGPMLTLPEGVNDPLKRQVFVAYDDKNFYIAWRFDRPKHVVQPRIPEKTGRVDSWRLGDACELMLDVGHTQKRYYGFVIYPNGAYSEGIGNPGMDRHWNCDWDQAATVTERGWEGEAAIPFKSLEMQGAPKPGDLWGFDIVDNQRTPFEKVGLYAFRGGGWHKYTNLGHLRFGKPASAQPVARVNHIGEGGDSMVEVALELINGTASAQNATATLKLYRRKDGADGGPKSYYDEVESGNDDAYASGQSEFEKSTELGMLIKDALTKYVHLDEMDIDRKISIDPNGRAAVGFSKKIDTGEFLLAYDLRSGSGEPLASGVRVFRIEPPLAIALKPYWLHRKLMHVDVDLRKVTVSDGASLAVTIHGKDPASEAITGAKTFLKGDAIKGTVTLSTASLSPGFYRVRAELKSVDGKTIAANQSVVEKPQIPAWHNNDYGKSLPKPWTPVVAGKDGKVQVWGREYDLSGVLPKRITSGDIEVLTSPVRFESSSNGRALSWKVRSLKLREANDLKAVFDAELESSVAIIAGTVAIEFDGLTWYDLKLTPKSDSATIDQFQLAVDFNPDYAELQNMHRWLNDPYISRKPLKPEKFNRDIYGKMQEMAIPFTCALWIGDERVGMSWYAEAPIDWQNKNPAGAVRVVPPDGKGAPAKMRFAMIDHQVQIDKPMRLQFGLQATPIRAMPDEDVLHCVQVGGPVTKEEYYKGIAAIGGKSMIYHGGWKGNKLADWGGWAAEPKNPEHRKKVKEGIRLAHKYGMSVALYTGWGVATTSDEWKNFRYEFARLPLENSGFGTYRQSAGLEGAYIDYMAYTHALLAKEYGADGVFWDSTCNLPSSKNIDIGNGWIDQKGNVREMYPIRATRELFKRVYTLGHGELKDTGLVVNFGGSIWCINAFADIFHRGEGTPMHVKLLKDAWKPMEDFRANYDGRKIGVPYLSMNKNFKRLPMTVSLHSAVTLLHGTHPKSNAVFLKFAPHWLQYDVQDYPMKHIWLARSWLPMDKNTIWYPYYRKEKQVVQLRPKELLSSVFVSSDRKRALLVVSNLEKKPVKGAAVSVDLKEIGLTGTVQAEDAILHQPVEISEGVIQLDIEPERYRLLKLWYE